MPPDDRSGSGREGLNRAAPAPDDRSGAGREGLNRAAPAPDDRSGAGREGLNRSAPAPDDRSGAPPHEAALRGDPGLGREGLNRAADSPAPWRRTGSRTALRDRWIHLRAETWETPKGVTLDPWWMLDWADWVHVIALTPDGRLVLVRQFRPGAQALTLELPGGMMEPGETDPVAAAAREFTEETGYRAAEWRGVIGLPPEPAHCSNRIHFVLALGCEPTGAQALDAGEDIAVEALPVAEVLAGLTQGIMQNAMHVGGLVLGLAAAGRLALAERPAGS